MTEISTDPGISAAARAVARGTVSTRSLLQRCPAPGQGSGAPRLPGSAPGRAEAGGKGGSEGRSGRTATRQRRPRPRLRRGGCVPLAFPGRDKAWAAPTAGRGGGGRGRPAAPRGWSRSRCRLIPRRVHRAARCGHVPVWAGSASSAPPGRPPAVSPAQGMVCSCLPALRSRSSSR